MLLLLLLPGLLGSTGAQQPCDQAVPRDAVQQMREEITAEFGEVRKEAEATKSQLKALKMEVAASKAKLETIEKETEAIKSELAATKTSLVTLETGLPGIISQAVRDIPFLSVCAFQDVWDTAATTITYDRIVNDYNNADSPGGGDGVLDVTTGVFTCLTAGHYTVAYSGVAVLQSGQDVDVRMYKNNADIGDEGRFDAFYSGSGLAYDQGSRTLVSVL